MLGNKINSLGEKYRNEGFSGAFYSTMDYAMRYPQKRLISELYNAGFSVLHRNDLKKKYTYTTFSADKKIEISTPLMFSPIPEELNHVIGIHEFEQPAIFEVNNGTILNNSGIVLADDGSIILESAQCRRPLLENHLYKNRRTLYNILKYQHSFYKPTGREVECAMPMITAPYEGNNGGYADWPRKFLPRLQAVELYKKKTGNKPKLILNQDPPSYQIQSLKTLGYNSDQFIFWDPSENIRVNNLVLPTTNTNEFNTPYYKHNRNTNRFYNSVSPNSLKWLRETAHERTNASSHEIDCHDKILISRRDVGSDRGRRISNFEQIQNALQKEGFVSYELGPLSFEQQIALFSEASEVVGVHGAGLANIAFSADCSIIEIFGSFIRPTYFMMAKKQGLDYAALLSRSKNENTNIDPYSDVRVAPEEILKLIKNI